MKPKANTIEAYFLYGFVILQGCGKSNSPNLRYLLVSFKLKFLEGTST